MSNEIVTTHVLYRGKKIPVYQLKDNSNIKVIVKCKHKEREIKWCKRHQLCHKCAAELGKYNTSLKGRNIDWGDKISVSKKGKKLSDEHRIALSKAKYPSYSEWPGFYKKRDIQKVRDSIEYLEFRKKIFSRDNFKCTITGKTGKLHMHHIDSMNTDISRAMDESNVVTLHETVHRKFHLVHGNGNNTVEQYENFKKALLSNNRKLIMLCGVSGCGKTTLANKLKDKFDVTNFDKNKNLKNIDNGNKPILLDIPVKITNTYKLLYDKFNVEMVFIHESIDVVRERILKRGGKISSSFEKRYARVQRLKDRYADFTGTADEVLEYLKALA